MISLRLFLGFAVFKRFYDYIVVLLALIDYIVELFIIYLLFSKLFAA